MAVFTFRKSAGGSALRGADTFRSGSGGTAGATITPEAIPSAEAMGAPVIVFSASVPVAGIASAEAMGEPVVVEPRLISLAGIASSTGAVVGPTVLTVATTPVPPYTPRISVGAYSRTGALLAQLGESFDRSWQDPLNDAGAGKVSMDNDDPDLAAVAYGSVVRFSLDVNACFAILVERKTRASIAQGEEADQATAIAGRGTLAIFEEGVVYPELGAGRPGPDARLFNFSSTDLDDSGWGFAVQSERGVGLTGGAREGAPQSWPDQDAWWIWSEYSETGARGPASSTRAGDVYFRRSFSTGATMARIFVSCDNFFELYLDGGLVLSDALQGGVSWKGTRHVDVFLDAGSHLVAVRGTNLPPDFPGAANPTGLIVSVIPLGDNGSTLGTPLLRSDSSWRVLPYPAQVPGFTPGAVVRILLAEAQARGALAGVALAFDDYVDSHGVAWPVTTDISFSVGTDYLTALRQLAETYLDLRMAVGSFTLFAYAARGAAQPVTLAAGTNLGELTHDGSV